MSFNLVLEILFTVLLVSSAPSVTPIQSQLNIFQANGKDTKFTSDQPVLNITRVDMACSYGVWMTFSQPNYNAEYIGYSTLMRLPSTSPCREVITTHVKSVRSFGNLENNTIPTVTYFSSFNFGGNAIVAEKDIPELDFPIESILTINTHVELFTGANFAGDSFYIDETEADCENGVCAGWSESYINGPFRKQFAKSVKFGCPKNPL